MTADPAHAATVGVVTETNAEKAIEELKAYEVSFSSCVSLHRHSLLLDLLNDHSETTSGGHGMHDEYKACYHHLQQTAFALWHAALSAMHTQTSQGAVQM